MPPKEEWRHRAITQFAWQPQTSAYPGIQTNRCYWGNFHVPIELNFALAELFSRCRHVPPGVGSFFPCPIDTYSRLGLTVITVSEMAARKA
jgi:hypothetical protein